jgi:hypothetical protein
MLSIDRRLKPDASRNERRGYGAQVSTGRRAMVKVAMLARLEAKAGKEKEE